MFYEICEPNVVCLRMCETPLYKEPFMFNRFSSRFSALALGVLIAGTATLNAFADTVGFVDYDKIRQGYEKAQTLVADIKVKEAELRKTQADFVKQIEDSRKANAKNPVASKNLEQQLQNRFKTDVENFNNWSNGQLQAIDKNVTSTIKVVAQRSGVSVVIDQRSIVFGGKDITNDVVKALNTGGAQ
jgi:outer membrane protein